MAQRSAGDADGSVARRELTGVVARVSQVHSQSGGIQEMSKNIGNSTTNVQFKMYLARQQQPAQLPSFLDYIAITFLSYLSSVSYNQWYPICE